MDWAEAGAGREIAAASRPAMGKILVFEIFEERVRAERSKSGIGLEFWWSRWEAPHLLILLDLAIG